MSRNFILLLVLVSLTVSTVTVNATSSASLVENSWAAKAPLPQTGAFRLAAVNGKIYAMSLDTNLEYDLVKNTWASKESMPTARTHFGIAVWQNKIYVIGGIEGYDNTTGTIASNVNEVYDPSSNTWETKKPMPTKRLGLNANAVDGKIYLIGGRRGSFQSPQVDFNEVYDVATDSWTTKKPIPDPVVDYASAVVDGKIYVIGGQDEFLENDLTVDFNQIYNPESDSWSRGASLPRGLTEAAAGATSDILAPKRIYVFGGGQDGNEAYGSNITQVYDPEKNTWSFGAPMPTARSWLTVAVVDDVFYVMGGASELFFPSLRTNEQYIPFGYGTMQEVKVISPENKIYNTSSIPLIFTLKKQMNWIGYSIDGEENITITGNTTLTGLTSGLHNVTVSAQDEFENTGVSETVIFSMVEPESFSASFPTTTIVVVLGVSVVAATTGVSVYLRKRKHQFSTSPS